MATPQKTFMSLDEVAKYLGISRVSVQRMVQRREIRSVKIGAGARNSPYRIRTDWIDQWAEKNSSDPRTGR